MQSMFGDEAFHASNGSLNIIAHEGEERAHEEDHIEEKQQEDVQTRFGECSGEIGRGVVKFGDLSQGYLRLP